VDGNGAEKRAIKTRTKAENEGVENRACQGGKGGVRWPQRDHPNPQTLCA
jgi:hypothetical protein